MWVLAAVPESISCCVDILEACIMCRSSTWMHHIQFSRYQFTLDKSLTNPSNFTTKANDLVIINNTCVNMAITVMCRAHKAGRAVCGEHRLCAYSDLWLYKQPGGLTGLKPADSLRGALQPASASCLISKAGKKGPTTPQLREQISTNWCFSRGFLKKGSE